MSNIRRRIQPTPRYTWPVVIPRPGDGGGGGDGGSDVKEHDVRITTVSDGDAIPIVYGRTFIGGKLFAVGVINQDIVLAYAISLAANGIDAYETIYVDDRATPIPGVTVYSYDGTQTSVCPALSGAFAGYTEYHPGLAYIVLRISPGSEIFGGIPNLRVLVRGRKVWTGSSYVYSDNPAWIARDILTAYDVGNISTSLIDDASFSSAATFFGETVNGYARYRAKCIIESRISPTKAAAELLEAFGGRLYLNTDGKLCAAFLKDYGPVDVTVSQDDIVLDTDGTPNIQVETEGIDSYHSHSVVTYDEPLRNGETYYQEIAGLHYAILGGAINKNEINGDFVGSSSTHPAYVTAARLAEEDMLFNYTYRARAQFDYLNYIAPGSVISLVPFYSSRLAYTMDGTAKTAVPSAYTAPSTTLRLAVWFTLRSASGELISWGTSPNGFAVSVDNSQYTIRLGSFTGTIARKNSSGIHIQMSLYWSSTLNKCYVFENGLLLGSLTPGISSVSATGNFTIGNGFSGNISLIDVRTTGAGIHNAGYVSVYHSSSGAYLRLTPNDTLNDGYFVSPPSTERLAEPFVVERCELKPRGEYHITARAFTRRSMNTGTAPTSNNTTITIYDSKPGGVGGPRPESSPPAVSGLFASATAYNQDGITRYRVSLSWARSQSSFVRGYDLYVNVGGTGEKYLGEIARTASGYEYDVTDPDVNHVFTIFPVNNFGDQGTGTSTSITPSSAAVGILSASASITYSPGLISKSTLNAFIGARSLISFIWQLAGTSSAYKRLSIYQNGHLYYTTESPFSTTSAYVWTANTLQHNWSSVSDIGLGYLGNIPSPTDPFVFVVETATGKKLTSSVTPTTYINAAYQNYGGVLPSYCLFHSGSYGDRLIAFQSSPANGSIPYFNGTDWIYARMTGGSGTIPSGSSNVWVPFAFTFSAPPLVVATPTASQMIWVTGVTTGGFYCYRATTTGALSFMWIAMG